MVTLGKLPLVFVMFNLLESEIVHLYHKPC